MSSLKNSFKVIPNPSHILKIVSSLEFLELQLTKFSTILCVRQPSVANLLIDIFLSLQNVYKFN